MTTLGCAGLPVSSRHTAASTPIVVRNQASSSSPACTSASTSSSLGALKVAGLPFVAHRPQSHSCVTHFYGNERRDSFFGSCSDEGWMESRKSQAAKCSPARAAQGGGEVPLRIMISGAPASGKGTQCELIVQQYNLTHIATGDLLRAEAAAGTESGKLAQEFMQKGQLVPNDIVVAMVKNKLYDAPNGWLLDGYPRSLSQAEALEALNIHPQLFILLEVPEEILVHRVVGRRLDPVTGKIYHLMYSPPETPEIAGRLTHRDDDTEEKVKLRLRTYASNVQSVLDIYKPVMKVVDGNRPKDQVFADIMNLIKELQGEPEKVGAQVISGGL